MPDSKAWVIAGAVPLVRRLLARMLLGAGIGIAVVIFFLIVIVCLGLDHRGPTDKGLLDFTDPDRRAGFVTIFMLGTLIGAAVGFVWAIGSKGHETGGENLPASDLWRLRAREFLEVGDHARVVAILTEVIGSRHRPSAEAFSLRAAAYRGLGEMQRAAEDERAAGDAR